MSGIPLSHSRTFQMLVEELQGSGAGMSSEPVPPPPSTVGAFQKAPTPGNQRLDDALRPAPVKENK